jgi:hypothetical protein
MIQLSHGEKWIAIAVLVPVGVIGIVAWRSHVNTVPVVNIPAYPVLPNPNGYDLFVKAGRDIIEAKPAVDEINDSNPSSDPKVRAERYSLERKQVWLNRNKKAFELFQKALSTPALHPPQRSALPPTYPEYKTLRELARCKSIEARTFALEGEWGKATQSRLDTLQFGIATADGGPLMASLVGIAIQAIGRNHWWNDVKHLNSVQCRLALSRLENIYAQRLRADVTLTEEKYCGQIMLLGVMRGPTWGPFWIPKRTVMSNYVQMMDAHIANARKPYLATTPVLAPNDPLTKVLAPVFDRAHWNFARNDAGNALWLVTLALRAHKLENGSYPVQLNALVPRYLKQIPSDPFGRGEPLRYQKRGNTYLLYSMGPDGIDNGGKAIAHRKNASASARRYLPTVFADSAGDYVAGRNR